MGRRETAKIHEILSALSDDKRLFRINSGMGWIGKILNRKKGIIVLENPRPLHAAPTGWPDLCGWESVTITPEMVGQTVAIFTGEEVKVTGKLSPDQIRFREIIERMGGRFIVHRS
jgi:hypothetical protein